MSFTERKFRLRNRQRNKNETMRSIGIDIGTSAIRAAYYSDADRKLLFPAKERDDGIRFCFEITPNGRLSVKKKRGVGSISILNHTAAENIRFANHEKKGTIVSTVDVLEKTAALVIRAADSLLPPGNGFERETFAVACRDELLGLERADERVINAFSNVLHESADVRLVSGICAAAASFFWETEPPESEKLILAVDFGYTGFRCGIVSIDPKLRAVPLLYRHVRGGSERIDAILHDLFEQKVAFSFGADAVMGGRPRVGFDMLRSRLRTDSCVLNISVDNAQERMLLTRREFETLVSPMLGEYLECLEKLLSDAESDRMLPEAAVLIGSAAELSLVHSSFRELIRGYFGNIRVDTSHPRTGTAIGASLIADRG